MTKEDLISAFGDGWYEGFLSAKKLVVEGEADLLDYNEDDILRMSEHAESESQIEKSA